MLHKKQQKHKALKQSQSLQSVVTCRLQAKHHLPCSPHHHIGDSSSSSASSGGSSSHNGSG
eukprot:12901055-Ditylum_brightwellii.AAC.1